MNEGLLILDAHRHVLLMNDSARAILHTGLPADGKTPLSVYNRSQTLLDTVEKAIAEGGAHADMSAGGREYLLTASTVRHNEGLVVLLQDVTERNASEAARKRFTANVSHELRTPLTTISGYAELIQSGMTEPKDIPVFARKIYNESRRLLKLIEDIMHLRQAGRGLRRGMPASGGPAGGRPDSGRGKCRSRGGSQRDRAPDGRERFHQCRPDAA